MDNRKDKSSRNGRPTKNELKLTTSINLKLTEADFNSVKEKAEKLGIKPTQYAREIVLKGEVKNRFSLEELDLMRKLAGMANNLNQIAKRVNKNEFLQIGLDLVVLANKIKDLLNDR